MSALPAKADIDHDARNVCFVPEADSCFVPAMVERGRQTTSGAALRSRKLGPIKAECFADLANRTGVKIVALTDQRQFRSPSCTVNHQSPVTGSSSFGLRIEATPMLGKPLSEGSVFH
jgi:hypothetical protein